MPCGEVWWLLRCYQQQRLWFSWADTAQWPNKPIRIVVSYPGGGVSDVVARALGEKLAVQLSDPYRGEKTEAGAGGAIGSGYGG